MQSFNIPMSQQEKMTIAPMGITPASIDNATLINKSISENFSSEKAAKATFDGLKIILAAVAFIMVSLIIDKKK